MHNALFVWERGGKEPYTSTVDYYSRMVRIVSLKHQPSAKILEDARTKKDNNKTQYLTQNQLRLACARRRIHSYPEVVDENFSEVVSERKEKSPHAHLWKETFSLS